MPRTKSSPPKKKSGNGLNATSRSILSRYVRDIARLPNESAKTHRFVALATELFTGSGIATELSAGIEKRVRIETSAGKKRGRIDAYHGNAIIEFENSLKATETTAKKQLREYAAVAPTLYDVLIEDISINEAIHETPFSKISIVPASKKLQQIDALLKDEPDAQIRLSDAFQELNGGSHSYDYVLLDCPPNIGLTPD